MNCPVCGERLREVNRFNVEIDVCPGCKGVWLDRGELEKVIEMASGEHSTARTEDIPDRSFPDRGREYREPDHHDRDHHHEHDDHDHDRDHGWGHGKRRKNFLSDLFGD